MKSLVEQIKQINYGKNNFWDDHVKTLKKEVTSKLNLSSGQIFKTIGYTHHDYTKKLLKKHKDNILFNKVYDRADDLLTPNINELAFRYNANLGNFNEFAANTGSIFQKI